MKDRKLRGPLLLITYGVGLYALLMNYQVLWEALSWVLGVLSPLLAAAAVALILNVPLRGFDRILARLDRRNRLRRGVRHGLSLALTLIFAPLLVFFVIRFVVPQLANAISGIIDFVRENSGVISEAAQKIGLDPAMVSDKIAQLFTWITDNIDTITGVAFSTAIGVFSSAASALMSLMLAIYLLADRERVRRQAARLCEAMLSPHVSETLQRVGRLFVQSFATFLSRQCLEAVILGGLVGGAMLAFSLPYALPLAVLTAVMALIPYVGAFLSLFVGVVMLLLVSPTKALIFAVVFLVMQQIEGNVIYPRVVGESVGLPAYVTLTAVTLGGALFGVLGMFFTIPVASVAYTLLGEAVRNRMAKRAGEGAND